MADGFLTATGTCHLFLRWRCFQGFALTLIGSNGIKSLCSTLPENPDLGFHSKVIPFSRSNHHVTKYGCFHLAQSRQRWYTFDANSRDICSDTHRSDANQCEPIRSGTTKFTDYRLLWPIISNENSFSKEQTSARTIRRFRFSRNSRQTVRAWLRAVARFTEGCRVGAIAAEPFRSGSYDLHRRAHQLTLEIPIFQRIL